MNFPRIFAAAALVAVRFSSSAAAERRQRAPLAKCRMPQASAFRRRRSSNRPMLVRRAAWC